MSFDTHAPSFTPPGFGEPSGLLQGLNPEQLAAVTLGSGHSLVLAGAGSGKTRVLTTRMAWLMQTGQVGPGGLMAVTFTNKAAKEMLVRLQAMLPVNVRGMWVGTFHGLCNRLLRAHWKAANLPQAFQILDTQDQLSAVKRLCKQFAVDDERFPAKQLTWFFSSCKEEGMRPADVPVRDDDTRKKVELYQLYEDQCQREGVVDFAELLLRSYELLRDHAEIREHYQRRFRHILVDEFQDTNKLQYAWLKQLVGPDTAVLAVGDDDQSIYAFRGARVGNMADFVREFNVGAQIKLEQNYRSHSNILDSANHLIGHNSQRLGKNLRTDQGAGEPVRVFESPTDFDEARWVVDCCTAATPRAECWKPHCSTPGWPTRCTAACGSSSAPKSNTPWPTCACWRTRATTPAFCAWSTSRPGALVRAASNSCKTWRAAAAAPCLMRSAPWAAAPGRG